MLSWVNGAPGEQLSVRDRGLAYGDGLFETIAVRGGRIPLLARHMARLADGRCYWQITLDATAAGLPRLNALSIIAAVPASSRPRPPAPMAPCRRMTETTGPLGRNGSQFIMADI